MHREEHGASEDERDARGDIIADGIVGRVDGARWFILRVRLGRHGLARGGHRVRLVLARLVHPVRLVHRVRLDIVTEVAIHSLGEAGLEQEPCARRDEEHTDHHRCGDIAEQHARKLNVPRLAAAANE